MASQSTGNLNKNFIRTIGVVCLKRFLFQFEIVLEFYILVPKSMYDT